MLIMPLAVRLAYLEVVYARRAAPKAEKIYLFVAEWLAVKTTFVPPTWVGYR
jgi:hypothetical protein